MTSDTTREMNDIERAHALGRALLEEGGFARLKAADQHLICAIAHRIHETRDPNDAFDTQMTRGERLADRVAAIGGSWGFVIGFLVALVVWTFVNAVILPPADAFDPYPFIFLNLMLSMLAAIQAPIIMMAQNRQSQKDRITARLDYEVNVKAENEVAQLNHRLARIERLLEARA